MPRSMMVTRDPRVALGPVPRGKNSYCGPAVVSAFTGIPTQKAAELLRQAGGRSVIKASSELEVTQALSRCGLQADRLHTGRRTPPRGWPSDVRGRVPELPATLGQLLSARFTWLRERYRGLVVVVTGHFLAVSGDWVVDTYHRAPTHVGDVGRKKRRVRKIYGVSGEPSLPILAARRGPTWKQLEKVAAPGVTLQSDGHEAWALAPEGYHFMATGGSSLLAMDHSAPARRQDLLDRLKEGIEECDESCGWCNREEEIEAMERSPRS